MLNVVVSFVFMFKLPWTNFTPHTNFKVFWPNPKKFTKHKKITKKFEGKKIPCDMMRCQKKHEGENDSFKIKKQKK
jgi:hypothetical protein